MSTSIGQNSLENQLDNLVRSFVQDKLETKIKEDMKSIYSANHKEETKNKWIHFVMHRKISKNCLVLGDYFTVLTNFLNYPFIHPLDDLHEKHYRAYHEGT